MYIGGGAESVLRYLIGTGGQWWPSGAGGEGHQRRVLCRRDASLVLMIQLILSIYIYIDKIWFY